MQQALWTRAAEWPTIGPRATHEIGAAARKQAPLIAPAHVIEPETPVENVLAFIRAVDKCGAYSVCRK
jgi:hypothetical protein